MERERGITIIKKDMKKHKIVIEVTKIEVNGVEEVGLNCEADGLSRLELIGVLQSIVSTMTDSIIEE